MVGSDLEFEVSLDQEAMAVGKEAREASSVGRPPEADTTVDSAGRPPEVERLAYPTTVGGGKTRDRS